MRYDREDELERMRSRRTRNRASYDDDYEEDWEDDYYYDDGEDGLEEVYIDDRSSGRGGRPVRKRPSRDHARGRRGSYEASYSRNTGKTAGSGHRSHHSQPDREGRYGDAQGRRSTARQSGSRFQEGQRNGRRKKGPKKLIRNAVIAALLCLIGFTAWSFLHRQTGIWTVAVFGVDSRDGGTEKALADVQMICTVDRATGEIKLTSVYRDTYLKIDSEGTYHKINEAYFRGGHEQAVAALEENAISSPTERIRTPYRWYYPNDPTHSYINCAGGDHGRLNITEAITRSCNYFFAEMGYELGMDTYLEYLQAFGLGEHTDIEIGDAAGTLPENPEGQDRAPWAAFGQANQAYTPLQLANYIATLVSGGEFCQPHLLKAVKTYDNTEVVTVGETKPERVVSISDSTLDAVKRGMLGYTQPGGSVYNAFRNCVVTAGAKTGTSQLGGDQTENGVFVCFAPYDDPEIAVAIVIEHATWGANVASTGVEILNAYFSADTNTSSVTGENQLLP